VVFVQIPEPNVSSEAKTVQQKSVDSTPDVQVESCLPVSATNSESEATTATPKSQTSSDYDDELPIVLYPAPLPTFSRAVANVLSEGNKVKVLELYGEIIRECSAFYSQICPQTVTGAKVSLSNIGKTMLEKYPVLAVKSGYQNAWTFFNQKLSSALRNARSRVKRKLTDSDKSEASTSTLPHSAKRLRTVETPAFIPVEIDEEEYKRHVAELKKQASKASPDIAQMKALISKTHVNRRAWINSKSSTELRLASIIGDFPCFKNTEILLEEFRLIKGQEVVNNFSG